jgi:major membrane immunogen (membrane-anchored lipoprotein)
MKKLLTFMMALVAVFTLAGCEKVATYKEGTYEAEVLDQYRANPSDELNTATAKVVINKKGEIESVYLDTTYQGTTKKTLKDDYNMLKNPSASGEWYVQVEKLEKAIVEHNGIDFITLKDDSTTDAVSGCTIKVDALVEATKQALEKAKN